MLRVFRFLLALWTTTNVVDVPMTPASGGNLGGHVFVSWSVWRVLIGPSVLRLFIRDSINARLKSHVCQASIYLTSPGPAPPAPPFTTSTTSYLRFFEPSYSTYIILHTAKTLYPSCFAASHPTIQLALAHWPTLFLLGGHMWIARPRRAGKGRAP